MSIGTSLLGGISPVKATGAIGSKPADEEEKKQKTAYMGPSIGNLLNGSQNSSSSEASAVRA